MTLVGVSLLASVAALVVSVGVCGLVAWAGPVDRPRDRGAHRQPTPTAGGLGVMAGASVGLGLFAGMAPAPLGDLGRTAAALGFAAALGLFGALDDLYDFGARAKFAVQIALALLFAVFVARIEAIPLAAGSVLPLGPVAGALGTALWLLVAVNAVNFMDGANGVAAGGVAIVFLALALAAFGAGEVAIGGAALTAAVAGLGFLPWNLPKARLFQGDAGALFSGFLLAALAVIAGGAKSDGGVFVLFAPLALLPFLTDVLLTLLARAQSRKRLFDAHSEHLYQRWLARRAGSHGALAARIYVVMLVFSGAAIALQRAGPGVRLGGFVAATLVAVAAWLYLSRRYGPARTGAEQ